MNVTAVELRRLCVYRAFAGRPSMVSMTPAGRRMIVPVLHSEWIGPRLRATQIGPSAGDSILVAADGTAMTSVHLAIRTDDGADVLATYIGRADWSEGPTSRPVRIGMTFETSSERYRWLNSTLAVGIGQFDGETIAYEMFEVS